MDPCAPDRSLPMHSTKSGGSPAAAASCRMRSTIRPLLTPWQTGTEGGSGGWRANIAGGERTEQAAQRRLQSMAMQMLS